ncbi:E3 ubiquitin-protein ligase parkin isoform 5-T5 [Menidia menidia]
MIVLVRYNLGPGVPVDLGSGSSVAQLQELVGNQQGVPPHLLRVLFNGRELPATASLQACGLPEQSTVHILPPPASPQLDPSPSGLTVVLEDQGGPGGEGPGPGPGPAGPGPEEPWAGAKRGPSSFFVFCKRCGSVRPGKLRVRCSRCRQGALTLTRGPSCWEDVLQPGRIQGRCHADGCHGDRPEFYMKCAAHPTGDDDTSVALRLIINNSCSVPCMACTDILPAVLRFSCPQQHVLCLGCFRRYCQTRLSERQFTQDPQRGYTLGCAAGCENSLIEELHHFRILGDEQYGRYQRFATEECVLACGGVLCPAPGCGAGLLAPDGERRVECPPRGGCGLVFCGGCRGPYHQGPCGGGGSNGGGPAHRGGPRGLCGGGGGVPAGEVGPGLLVPDPGVHQTLPALFGPRGAQRRLHAHALPALPG